MGSSNSQPVYSNQVQYPKQNFNVPTFQPKVYQPTIYPNLSKTHEMRKLVVTDSVLERFIAIQDELKNFDGQGIFEGFKKVEDNLELLMKSKKQAEINYKVLCEQSNKEKLDFDNIMSPSIQAFFRTEQDHFRAIEKERVF